MIGCLTDEQIEDLVGGALLDEEARGLEAHVDQCPSCSARCSERKANREYLERIQSFLPKGPDRRIVGSPEPQETETVDSSAWSGAWTIPGYKILRELHRGGQGVVYEAVQQSTRRKVAIKVLVEGVHASDGARRRFEREIELVAQLKHPSIIAIFDSGATHEGHQYCVMDYVRGLPLDRYVRQHRLALDEALRLFCRVCEAVNYAHQKGVIHRDLKPSNILVDVGGNPKVLDFGLAKTLTRPEASVVTLTGQVIGTLPYISPEQARSNPDEIDIRTDVYSLGVILYEVLTGGYPYPVAGQMLEVLRHISETPPTPPSKVWKPDSGITRPGNGKHSSRTRCPIDDELQTIVLKALAKELGRRYQSAGVLAEDIKRYLQGQPIEAKKDSTLYVLGKALARYRAAMSVGAAFLTVVIIGLCVSVILWQQAVQQRDRAMVAETTAITERDAAEQARRSEVEQRRRADLEAGRATDQAEMARQAQLVAEGEKVKADAARELAESRAEDLRRTTYFQTINLAGYEYGANNRDTMDRLLSRCPEDLRGWEWHRLNWLRDRSRATLRSHSGAVICVAFSPNGKMVASGSMDNTVIVWDMDTFREVVRFAGHAGWVNSVAFSPDGRKIASGSSDETVRIWDLVSQELVRALHGHQDPVSSLTYSPDGRHIFSSGWDKTIRVWDAEGGSLLETLRGHDGPVYAVALTRDGNRLVSGSEDGTIKVWDTSGGRPLPEPDTLIKTGRKVTFVDISPNGEWILSCSRMITDNPWRMLHLADNLDDVIRIWDLQSGQEKMTLRGHTGPVYKACFSPDGERIVSASFDRTLRVWNAENGRVVATIIGHPQIVFSVAFSPNSKWIASGDLDAWLKVWQTCGIEDAEVVGVLDQGVCSVAEDPGGKWIVTGDRTGQVWVWDLIAHERKMPLLPSFKPLQQTRGSELWSLLLEFDHKSLLKIPVIAQLGAVFSVAVGPDGRRIAASRWNGTVDIWQASTGNLYATLSAHVGSGSAYRVAFSPDGRWLVSGGGKRNFGFDPTLKLWDVNSGQQKLVLRGHSGSIESVVFRSDGKRLVSGSWDGHIRVWDAETGKPVSVWRSDGGRVCSVTWSPDGKVIASGTVDGVIRLWDAIGGQEVRALSGHADLARSLAFSPDGRRIVSGGNDHLIKIWDVETGQEAMTLGGHRGPVNNVVFSHDGKSIFSASDDKTIRIWRSGPVPD